jgi:hypothetical protein
MLILSEEEHELLFRIIMTFGVYQRAEETLFQGLVQKLAGPYVVKDVGRTEDLVDQD